MSLDKKSAGITAAVVFVLLLVSIILAVKLQKVPVVFNIKSTYTSFLQQASSHDLSKQEIVSLGRAFPKALTMSINSYAKKHNVVIYAQNAVIAGAKDVTKDIQLLIKQNMQNLIKHEKQHG